MIQDSIDSRYTGEKGSPSDWVFVLETTYKHSKQQIPNQETFIQAV